MSQPPAPYGHDLEPELHAQLRTHPPAEALEWVRRSADAQRVVSVTALHGGRSSAVHLVVVELGAGTQRALVLRRYVLDWVEDEPEAPGNEALVLRHLASEPQIPSPRLVAADPDGSQTGAPATLMTARPGELVWRPRDVAGWLDALVGTMIEIHRVPVSAELARWYPYAPELVPPPWTQHPSAWERALTAYEGPRPESAPVFLHRDYHPGNVLWTDGRVSGVVDWVSSCVGPAEEDVAHCRADLALRHSFDAADELLRRWQRATGRSHAWDPYWDLVNLVSCAGPDPDPAMDAWIDRITRSA